MEYLFPILIFAFFSAVVLGFHVLGDAVGIEAEPALRQLLKQTYRADALSIGRGVVIVFESIRYFDRDGADRRLKCWRILRNKEGRFYKFRATVWEWNNCVEHSMVRVRPATVRRWLFWRSAAYRRVFGETRHLRDLNPFQRKN